MNKEYKCAACGSIVKDAPGTCCGGERKEVAHMDVDNHNHDKKEAAGVCLACQGDSEKHTCASC